MQNEPSDSRTQSTIATCLIGLVILALVLVAGVGVFGMQVLQKLDRVVAVVENVNDKVERVAEATAPLGKAAVEKGIKTLDAVDTDDLGKAATEGVKEIGRSVKQRAMDAIKKQNRAADDVSN
jgi:hypothetical protein